LVFVRRVASGKADVFSFWLTFEQIFKLKRIEIKIFFEKKKTDFGKIRMNYDGLWRHDV